MNKGIKIKFRNNNCELRRFRVRPRDIPDMYIYDIRHDDSENPSTIEQHVQVNYWGTLISDKPINLSDGNYYDNYSILSSTEIDELIRYMENI